MTKTTIATNLLGRIATMQEMANPEWSGKRAEIVSVHAPNDEGMDLLLGLRRLDDGHVEVWTSTFVASIEGPGGAKESDETLPPLHYDGPVQS